MKIFNFTINTSLYHETYLYQIEYIDKDLAVLSECLNTTVSFGNIKILNILKELQTIDKIKIEPFLKQKCGTNFIDDIELEWEKGKSFRLRDQSTGYHLGRIGHIYSLDVFPAIFYRMEDNMIIILDQNTLEIPPVLLPLGSFCELLEWWLYLPKLPPIQI